MKDIYLRADPKYSGRYSVPVLWDKKLETIVNNESAEIIKIFNSAFNSLLSPEKAAVDLCPSEHAQDIEELCKLLQETVNEGVYRAGVAQTQEAYETAARALFNSLDRVENMLIGKDFVVGGVLTEVEVRLYTTIVRFDPVYYGHYKCNLKNIRDGYPAIHLWLRKLYWNNASFHDTTNFDHIKASYYGAQKFVNPTGIIPIGPQPHIHAL